MLLVCKALKASSSQAEALCGKIRGSGVDHLLPREFCLAVTADDPDTSCDAFSKNYGSKFASVFHVSASILKTTCLKWNTRDSS